MRPTCLVLALLVANGARAADPRLEGYRTPPGWKVEIAATEPLVINPVTMAWGPDARLYVIEWTPGAGPNDRVKVLTDQDGDGTFDKADIYIDHLEMPAGILFWDGWTYLSLGHDVVRWKDRDGDGTFETKETVATGFGNDNSHHRVSGLTIGPDGWLYMTTGDSDAHAKGSDGSTATVLRCGGVFRCKPDGSKLEVVAFGMRNPWGNVCFDDAFNMFHTDNDNEGSEGFTGCRLLHVVEGGDYGWRLREGARCCQPDYDRATWEGGRPGRLGPMTLTGRGAPAGLCCLNSSAFPPSTRNLLVYPDVFRKLVRAYVVKPSGATFAIDREFELLASDDPLFRPDDAELGPDGALYILDWRTDSGGAGQHWGNGTTGRIYRLTWSGTDNEPALKTLPRDRLVKLMKAENDELVAALKDEDGQARRVASLELTRRLLDALESIRKTNRFGFFLSIRKSLNAVHVTVNLEWQIMKYLDRPVVGPGDEKRETPVWARRCALLIVSPLPSPRSGEKPEMGTGYAWILGRGDDDPGVRRLTLELMARFGERDDSLDAEFLLEDQEKKDANKYPQVRRARALAFGRFDRLRRAKPGDMVRWAEAQAEYDRTVKGLGDFLFQPPEPPPGLDALVAKMRPEVKLDPEAEEKIRKQESAEEKLREHITTDMIARTLLEIAVDNAAADPVLRDGVTRGLERLGPAGLEAVVKGMESGDKATAEAALFALQGWRSREGLDAILAAATGKTKIPAEARANLFRALREMGDPVPPGAIAKWLVEDEAREPAPRAVAAKVLAAKGPKASEEAARVVPVLLRDKDASVRNAAIELAGSARAAATERALLAFVEDDNAAVAERRKGLEELRKYNNKTLTTRLENLFHSTHHDGLRAEVLRTLAPLDFDAAASRAKTVLSSSDASLRHEAIAMLGQRPETALAVATLYNDGKMPREDLPRVIEAVRSHATPELQAATQALLKKTLLAAPEGAEAERLREFVRRHGNPDRGKAIFLDAKKGNCASCHRLEGVGTALGPDLTRVWQTLSFEKRAESILDPSKEIKEGYRSFKVATNDGRVVTGLLVADKADGVTLRDAQGRETTIPAADIDQKGPDATSLMPAGVAGNLSLNELADLLAFLGDRRAQESLREDRR